MPAVHLDGKAQVVGGNTGLEMWAGENVSLDGITGRNCREGDLKGI